MQKTKPLASALSLLCLALLILSLVAHYWLGEQAVKHSGHLLIASQNPAHIQVCNTKTWSCTESGSNLPIRPQLQFKALPDTSRNLLLLTDARGDRLLSWDV